MRIAESNYPAAANIVRIIKEKGLKQVYVAEKAGYTPQELNDMLNGRKVIKTCDILRLSNAVGTSVNALFEVGEGSEKERGAAG